MSEHITILLLPLASWINHKFCKQTFQIWKKGGWVYILVTFCNLISYPCFHSFLHFFILAFSLPIPGQDLNHRPWDDEASVLSLLYCCTQPEFIIKIANELQFRGKKWFYIFIHFLVPAFIFLFFCFFVLSKIYFLNYSIDK